MNKFPNKANAYNNMSANQLLLVCGAKVQLFFEICKKELHI